MTDWSKPLSEPITLRSGAVLGTLGDVGKVLLEVGRGVTRSEPLAYAGELLIWAAESGDDEAIAAATRQVRLYLESRAMLPIDYVPKAQRWRKRKRA